MLVKFKPMLAPNDQVNLYKLQYPLYASYKLDGIRCLFVKGEMLTRSLKPIPNKQLHKKFNDIKLLSAINDLILDGELYSHELNFQQHVSYIMAQDKEPHKSIKFVAFDLVEKNNFDESYSKRIKKLGQLNKTYKNITTVHQWIVTDYISTKYRYSYAIKNDYEGLILRNPNGRYKCGRATIKQALIYKVKPFITFDAKIEKIIQATVVKPGTEKKVNELGRSVTSRKKNDRMKIEKAGALQVKYKGKDCIVALAVPDVKKKEIWTNRSQYIGKWIEYKGMLVGAKDVPRHPVLVRFRDDK